MNDLTPGSPGQLGEGGHAVAREVGEGLEDDARGEVARDVLVDARDEHRDVFDLVEDADPDENGGIPVEGVPDTLPDALGAAVAVESTPRHTEPGFTGLEVLEKIQPPSAVARVPPTPRRW